MPEPRHWHLVMYDVSEPKSLKRVHKLLCAWGQPVQYSVFRVRATDREFERLRFEISRIVDSTDRVLWARLCNGCAGRIQAHGKSLAPFELDTPCCHVA